MNVWHKLARRNSDTIVVSLRDVLRRHPRRFDRTIERSAWDLYFQDPDRIDDYWLKLDRTTGYWYFVLNNSS